MTNFPQFNRYACPGDTVSVDVDGYTLTATIYHDDCTDRPDERDDGFWPSRDPGSAGYVLPENFDGQHAIAEEAMRSWLAGEWFYCGIAVTVERAGVQLTGRYSNALWGIECNYPDSDNGYLAEVADELMGEAIAEAQEKLSQLCAA